MHFEAFALDLVSSKDTQKLVAFQELFDWFLSEVVRTLALWIVFKVIRSRRFVVHRIRPKQVAENAVEGDLLESVYLVNLFYFLELRRDASVHSQILLCNQCSNRECVEHLHEQVVHFNIVSLQNFFSKGKGFSHIT